MPNAFPSPRCSVVLVATLLAAGCEDLGQLPDPLVERTGPGQGPSIADRVAAGEDLPTAAALYAQEAQNAQTPEARADALEKLGEVFLAANEPRRAAGAYREALSLAPGRPTADVGLGKSLVLGGEPEAAIPSLERAAAKGESTAFSPLGVAYDLTGRQDEAATAYDRGLAARPRDLDLASNRAISLALAGQHDQAYNAIRPVADAVWATDRHRRNLVLVLAISGRETEARREAAIMKIPSAEVGPVLDQGRRLRRAPATERAALLLQGSG